MRKEVQAGTKGVDELPKEAVTLALNEYIHTQVEEYLLILMDDVENSL